MADNKRNEIIGGLQRRIQKERLVLHRRLEWDGADEQPAGRPRKTGRLYRVFQAVGEDD